MESIENATEPVDEIDQVTTVDEVDVTKFEEVEGRGRPRHTYM